MVSIENVRDALYKSWSLESSSKWMRKNPAIGQCGVTALVVNDLFGGEIVKTMCTGDWHFYNKLNGVRYDFTEEQFSEAIKYDDIPSSREEAFLDTNLQQYNALRKKVYQQLSFLNENLL
ncbi:hypothetical protein BTA37_27635 [Priestia megaterium]|jgi:hypothetical protein|uniref:YunG family protein n=1 Tax=Priestia megaterium TaxID=1404 RepID=UPI00094DB037|nr:hypothetical protein [Priestia megaterium]OLO26574.1 hypothetical protein BTA37_27635 [Priestia megaterium]